MKIQFTGMMENFYQGEEKNGHAATQWVTFLDKEVQGGKVKLASSEVDLSALPYLELVEIVAEVKGSPGSKPGAFNYWVQSASVRILGALPSATNPNQKGGEKSNGTG